MTREWQDFLAQIQQARVDLGNPKIVWYRGHSKTSYQLVPSLFRAIDGYLKEEQAFVEFRRIATRLFSKKDSDWEVLFDMQHYGVPTRLLDWSEALGVAIAFALLTEYDGGGDCVIYALDPVALNKYSGLQGLKILPDQDFQYKGIYWNKKPFAPQFPIATYPPLQSERLFAQRGTFTIHGDDRRSLDLQCPSVVKRIVLPAAAKADAVLFLEYANLDDYSIYPDMVGMSRHLARRLFPR